MTITPDTKDWTWVIDRPCPECGFVATEFPVGEAAAAIRADAAMWAEALRRPDATMRTRPDRWSVLEYACHVRDVHRVYLGRLERMLTEDDPLYANWDQDATAVADRYADQDPMQVADQLSESGAALALAYDGVPATAWTRTGRRSDGASFTIASFTRYLIHDLEHHGWDVGRAGAGRG